MSERLYRTQLLLRPEQHRRLVLLSKDEGRSISEVARSLLDEALLAHQSTVWESRSHVIERLRIFRNRVREHRGAVEIDLITESRNERENESSNSNYEPSCGKCSCRAIEKGPFKIVHNLNYVQKNSNLSQGIAILTNFGFVF